MKLSYWTRSSVNSSSYGRLDTTPFEFSFYENHSRKRPAPVMDNFSASRGCPAGARLQELRLYKVVGDEAIAR